MTTTATGSMVERILAGDVPQNVKAAAARGALPVSRAELARLFIALARDPDPEIQKDARASLTSMDREAVVAVLEDAGCAPEVLLFFSKQAGKDEDLAEKITFHPNVPNQALEVLAQLGSTEVIELILTNQERLLMQPGLLDRLTVNASLRADQRGRILELLDRIAKMSGTADAATGETTDAEEQVDGPSEEFLEEAAKMLDVEVGEVYAASEIMGGEEFEEDEDPEVRSAYRKIVGMNVAQKAVLAMKGGREERMILIRDTNKVVALSVLKNPRISDNDIESISNNRSISDDVLRTIALNREWVKNYPVAVALVRNPRTPPGVSTNFITRLQNRDLKNLIKDRNVAELIRRMARRTFDQRTAKDRKKIGKKH